MARAQRLHRLPPNLLWNTSRASTTDPQALLDLCASYEALKGNPAWEDFWGMLAGLKKEYERDLLLGSYDKRGRDLTHEKRASYGTLLQIMSIPAERLQRRQLSEEALGIPPREGEQSPWAVDESLVL